MQELKKCPFCSGKQIDVVQGMGNITFINCLKCSAIVSFKDAESIKNAIKAWNKREV